MNNKHFEMINKLTSLLFEKSMLNNITPFIRFNITNILLSECSIMIFYNVETKTKLYRYGYYQIFNDSINSFRYTKSHNRMHKYNI